MFSVAVVTRTKDGYECSRTTLESIRARSEDMPKLHFLLPQREVTIVHGNIHRAEILELHDDRQLVEFEYANTYMASSIYRAYADRIEPVSFKIYAAVGQAMLAMILILPAYVLAWLITFIRNRLARRGEAQTSNEKE